MSNILIQPKQTLIRIERKKYVNINFRIKTDKMRSKFDAVDAKQWSRNKTIKCQL